MARHSEPDAPQGLNQSYYNPDEPLDSNSQEPSSSSRRSKAEKSSRNRSPGDDNKSRRGSRRDPSPSHSNMSSGRRYPPPPVPLPPQGRHVPYDPYYDTHPPRDSPRESRRSSQRDAPRGSHYRDDDRHSRDYVYPPEPRERRHKSSHREPPPEQYPRSRHASPDPKSRSSRSHTTDDRDHRDSRRSRGAPAYASDDERDRRRQSHRSRPREADTSHGRSQNRARSRDRDRAPADGGRSPLKRRSTTSDVKSSGTRAKTSLWKHPEVQAIGKNVLAAGAQAFMQHRKGEGKWLGAKGARVATDAITAALADRFSNKGKQRS